MKLLPLLLATLALTAVSSLSQAEIYKWKDKDGKVRYSDTPPPSNVKQESIAGKKKPAAPTGKEPLAPVGTAAVPTAAIPKNSEPPPNPEDLAAEQRQRNAEAEKNNKLEKQAEAKRKAENCSAAKANMETYTQGGRVYKMNEKGEREYMDDNDFKAGKEKAQQEINENC
jgi:FKBP-type peptidyl-prolyl cis-trans isomerase